MRIQSIVVTRFKQSRKNRANMRAWPDKCVQKIIWMARNDYLEISTPSHRSEMMRRLNAHSHAEYRANLVQTCIEAALTGT